MAGTYTQAQVDEAIRKTLSPAILHTYIADGDEVPTGTLAANTPTKYSLPVTAKKSNNFTIVDLGGGNTAAKYTGTEAATLKLDASSSMVTDTNNMNVTLYLYKNGSPVAGAAVSRKVGTGADVGAFGLTGTVDVVTDDLLEVYIESDTAGAVTLLKSNIVLLEVN